MIGGTVFDHTVTVWRFSESRGVAFREVKRDWSTVFGLDGVRISVQTRRETRGGAGPGEVVRGEYKGFAPAGMNVCEGDVIEVTAGPESPLTVEVDSVRRPRGRHAEFMLTTWTGEL